MVDVAKLGNALAGLYEGLGGEDGWTKSVEIVRDLFGADSASLWVKDDRASGFLGCSGREPEIYQPYSEYYYAIDERQVLAARRPVGVLYADGVTDPFDGVKSNQAHNDYYVKVLRAKTLVGAFLFRDPDLASTFTLHWPTDPSDRYPISKDDMKLFEEVLVPNFRRAMLLQRKLHHSQEIAAASKSALDSLASALLVVDEDARLITANAAGEAVLAKGVPVSSRRGIVIAATPDDTKQLHDAIRCCARFRAPHCTQRSILRLGRPPVSAMIVPASTVYALPSGFRRHVLVLIGDSEHRAPRTAPFEILAQIYDLTPAEGRLAQALIEGVRLQDYADRMNLSIHTVKTQLKQIFQKTGCSRQSDLMRAFLGNPFMTMLGG
jgi:DNA-binding CsgD family transcriptional regulator